MALGYRRVDRDQQFLLPPDMREWLPDDHLVWFVLEVVSQLDTRGFHVGSRRGGVGREGFDPDMLLGLLIYAAMRRVRSFREIERLCRTDVAFRVCCAQDVPDHSTLARFRGDHQRALAELFAQVLGLCARAGMGRLVTVAIDGTKIAADASIDRSHSEVELRRMAQRFVAESVAVDRAEDDEYGADRRGDEPPEGLRGAARRAARIGELLADIDAEKRHARQAARAAARERAAGKLARAEARLARERAALTAQAARRAVRETAAAGRGICGARPTAVEDHTRMVRARRGVTSAHAGLAAAERADPPRRRLDKQFKRNLTDIDSRVMPTRRGWVQGYNCQLAVTADHLIAATGVSQDPVDAAQFGPMLAAVADAVATITKAGTDNAHGIGVVLADAGYASVHNLTFPGPDRLIALGTRRAVEHAAATAGSHTAGTAEHPAREQMRKRLRSAEGLDAYRHRSATVETVIGQLKDRLGLRKFSRRGLPAVTSELDFTAAVFNLLRLHTYTTTTAT